MSKCASMSEANLVNRSQAMDGEPCSVMRVWDLVPLLLYRLRVFGTHASQQPMLSGAVWFLSGRSSPTYLDSKCGREVARTGRFARCSCGFDALGAHQFTK